jgi:hypothetical protein
MPHHTFQCAAEIRSLKRELPEEHRERVARAVEICDQIVNTPKKWRPFHVGCTLSVLDGRAVLSDRRRAGKLWMRRPTEAEAYQIDADFHVMRHRVDGRGLLLPQLAALFRKMAKDLNASAAKLERADRHGVCQ